MNHVPDSVELSNETSVIYADSSGGATSAIDGNLYTFAESDCKFDIDIYYRIRYTNIKCIKEIQVIQSGLVFGRDAMRMNGTTVTVSNSGTGVETDCGVLIAREGSFGFSQQTYIFSCSITGDEIQLMVNHKKSEYDTEGSCFQKSYKNYAEYALQMKILQNCGKIVIRLGFV